jgi:hypothetical protein
MPLVARITAPKGWPAGVTPPRIVHRVTKDATTGLWQAACGISWPLKDDSEYVLSAYGRNDLCTACAENEVAP